jgi:hypothetical protein
MDESRTTSLRALATERGLVGGPFGSSLVGNDYVSDGVPVIRGSNLNHGRYVGGDFVYVSEVRANSDLARNLAMPDDLIFTQRGTLGQVAMIPTDGQASYVVSQSQMRLRVNPAVADTRFVYYACSMPAFLRQVADNAIATGVPHINLGILSRLTIELPLLRHQKAIAAVLGALDDKIAANLRAEITIDELLAALYRRAIDRPEARAVPLFDALRGRLFHGIRNWSAANSYSRSEDIHISDLDDRVAAEREHCAGGRRRRRNGRRVPPDYLAWRTRASQPTGVPRALQGGWIGLRSGNPPHSASGNRELQVGDHSDPS